MSPAPAQPVDRTPETAIREGRGSDGTGRTPPGTSWAWRRGPRGTVRAVLEGRRPPGRDFESCGGPARRHASRGGPLPSHGASPKASRQEVRSPPRGRSGGCFGGGGRSAPGRRWRSWEVAHHLGPRHKRAPHRASLHLGDSLSSDRPLPTWGAAPAASMSNHGGGRAADCAPRGASAYCVGPVGRSSPPGLTASTTTWTLHDLAHRRHRISGRAGRAATPGQGAPVHLPLPALRLASRLYSRCIRA